MSVANGWKVHSGMATDGTFTMTLRRVWPERLGKMVAGVHQLQDEIGADHDLNYFTAGPKRSTSSFHEATILAFVFRAL